MKIPATAAQTARLAGTRSRSELNCKVGSRALFTIVGGSVLINPVFAQEPAADEVPEVIVTGHARLARIGAGHQAARPIPSSTRSPRTDIGAFPDKSVAEALQRVPGITVSRLQSNDDSNHFSAEPATVLIRGLTFVRTEFNGRDSFSADGYRGLNFNDVSPELMAGVDSYKNQTAEMIEGGIAGMVNLRTRMPFDSDGQQIALTGRANYGDLSEEPTYEVSGVYSNNWETDSGPLRPAGECRVLEHPDAHRSRQHDAHHHVVLGLPAGGWRIIRTRCSTPMATSPATTVPSAARAGATRPAR